MSPFLCADLSYGWGISHRAAPAPAPDAAAEDGENSRAAAAAVSAATASPPAAPLSLRPRAPGDPFRPVGFPPEGTRTIVLENIGKAGLSDRMSNLKHALLLGRFLGANVSAPRPCEALTGAHSGYIPPCEVGWDHYIESRQRFHGYASGEASLRAPEPPCDPAAKKAIWPILASPPAALNASFCLSVDGAVFPHKAEIRAFVETLAASVWGCDPVAASVDAVEAEEELGYSDAVLRRVDELLRQYAPSRRFGVLHLRRGDRREYLDCTELPLVIEAFQRAVRAAGPAAQGLKWFIFSTEKAYSDALWTRMVATGLAAPGDLLLETELPELDTEAFGGDRADNYFAMRAMHWLIQHAEVSIRTSTSNDWMWAGEERLRRAAAGAGGGGVNASTPAEGATQVHYLCGS